MSTSTRTSIAEESSNKKDQLCWWFTGPDYYTKDDIKLLRYSFSLIREQLSLVGTSAFTKLFDEYPSAFKVFVGKKVLPESRAEVNYSWETKQHSLRVFHAIEKSLNRLTNPEAFRTYIRAIALRHVIYGAHPNHVMSLIGALRSCMLNEIKNQWSNPAPPERRLSSSIENGGLDLTSPPIDLNDPAVFDRMIAAWNKFFSALSLGIVSSMSAALPVNHSSDENDDEVEFNSVTYKLASATYSALDVGDNSAKKSPTKKNNNAAPICSARHHARHKSVAFTSDDTSRRMTFHY